MRLAALMMALAGMLHAQISYVASAKPNHDPDARAISEYFPGGRLQATAVPVMLLLRLAFRTQPYLVVGAPAWVTAKRFDVQAKADGPQSPSQQELLQALLRDRFGLAAHQETRELPIFALLPARKDGKLGAAMLNSDFDCAAYRAGPHPPPQPGKTPPCAMRVGPAALSGKAVTMTQLAASLSGLMQRTTVDRTGLLNRYDIELTWTPEATSAEAASNSSAAGPGLVTALMEQLGLKLVSDKGPVEVLVVDRIVEPSAN